MYRKGLRTTFLSQEPVLDQDLTIEETILNSDNPILKVINTYHEALENPEDSNLYQTAFDDMERYQAWDFETQYTQILFKLKLENLDQKVRNFLEDNKSVWPG